MNIQEKTIVIIGTGISGMGAARLLLRAGASPILYDGNEKLNPEEIKSRLPESGRIELVLGEMPETLKKQAELVIVSPGVPSDLPLVEDMRQAGAEIWGEIELAYYFEKGKIAAITGTNGKTTTTTLVGEIMKSCCPQVYVVGNIGTPYTEAALDTTEESVTVAEISSFQLETIHSFRPKVSAVLNITPDHLNRHHTMECYIEMKRRIAENQEASDTCVLNYDDEVTRAFGKTVKASVLYFSRRHILDKGAYLEGDTFYYSDGASKRAVCRICELHLLGAHNYENVLAAIAISAAFGAPLEKIRETIIQFQAVEHRIEYVEEIDGVVYYNDSKGTNTDAAIKAVEAMTRPTIVIGGGYDKHVEFDAWVQTFAGKVKCLVLLGATAEQIAATARRYGFEEIFFAESLKEAVCICREQAEAGDAVLLSPACASWGMFDNYEQRGTMFKEYVRALKKENDKNK